MLESHRGSPARSQPSRSGRPTPRHPGSAAPGGVPARETHRGSRPMQLLPRPLRDGETGEPPVEAPRKPSQTQDKAAPPGPARASVPQMNGREHDAFSPHEMPRGRRLPGPVDALQRPSGSEL